MPIRSHSLVFSAVAVLLFLGGCAHPVEKRLEGRWLGQGVENVDDGLLAVSTGWARGTSIEFAGSTVTVTIPAEDPRSASYEVVSVEENQVELALETEQGREKARVYLDGEDSLRWDIGGGRSVMMRREL